MSYSFTEQQQQSQSSASSPQPSADPSGSTFAAGRSSAATNSLRDQQPLNTIHWFRRGLRFHDNPALSESIKLSSTFRCIYIIDPTTINPDSDVESNKWRFLLECLNDLDSTLRKHNSRLYVHKGQPTYILPRLFKEWDVNILSIEEDPTPYGARRDEAIATLAQEHGVYVIKHSSHTLHPINSLIDLTQNGRPPKTLKQFAKIFQQAGPPARHLETIPFELLSHTAPKGDQGPNHVVPTLQDLGISESQSPESMVWHGGETEGLRRLAYHLERRAWVACFDKPTIKTRSLMASPSSLGPYLNFGCLSSRLLYWKMNELYRQIHGQDSEPPLSLYGQLLVREYYYLVANLNSYFDSVDGNSLCLQIPWKKTNFEVMRKVNKAETGFPWIDAIITQLVNEGWIHGVAKQALIGFITYGQLFFSWEEAAKLLDKYCLEGDICTNSGVAMMLSGSNLTRSLPSNMTSPVLTGKDVDPGADLIRHYVPSLKSFPSKYIYEPWTAPLDVQQQAGCVIGQDYPHPMLEHYQALHSNMLTLQQFLHSLRERHAHKKRRHSNGCHTASSNQSNGYGRAVTENHGKSSESRRHAGASHTLHNPAPVRPY